MHEAIWSILGLPVMKPRAPRRMLLGVLRDAAR
jgi:hypothetical protein